MFGKIRVQPFSDVIVRIDRHAQVMRVLCALNKVERELGHMKRVKLYGEKRTG